MSNPAGAPNQVIGVFDHAWLVPMAETLRNLGSAHVLLVHAEDGLDEISIGSETHVVELKGGEIHAYTIAPEDFGFQRADLSKLAVSGPQESLAIIRGVLDNQPGPARDIVCLNAGASIYAAGCAADLKEGVALADQVIAQGLAKQKLTDLIAFGR
jgi:anthranilate phosphoribosyltransferase